ncbi:glutathione S-transferase C-terminal-like protein [Sphaerosporella brunnea]|uniref:Glutathione S-transferase C-terminal-like protein n=1 Tax=Sphaerosporella brunnea TaxID=1250544 RepID=A0A5J5EKK5_9PEZI|nr:glutathione S-transferase C-terminal-like protein [Sphaerosporella brunnea]
MAETTSTVAVASNGYSAQNPQFTLYSHRIGPNGFKVAEVLSELGLHYRTIFLDFGAGENGMKTPAYEAINPNGRIPALIDHSANDLVVWESAAIILYVCKKYDGEFRLWAPTLDEQAQIETWLMYQATGQGPYLGQAFWFMLYHPERLDSATERYVDETKRVLGIVQKQLAREGSNGWLVLGRITAADIAFLHWYLHIARIKIVLKDEFPIVWEWVCRMKERPGVKAGMEGAVFPEGATVLKT